MEKVKLTVFRGGEKTVCDVEKNTTVLAALSGANVGVYAPCGGAGTCGKCKVKASGALSEPEEYERRRLTEDELHGGVRLACRVKILGDATVRIDDAEMTIETGGLSKFATDKSDGGEGLGVAVDIGTTTVAVYVCDLESGSILKTASFKNPQAVYGADVISRIDKIVSSSSALDTQRKILVDAINSAISGICDKLYKSITYVKKCVLCGNTVMEHIFCGIDPTPIARVPFTAPTLFENGVFDAASFGINAAPDAKCLVAPCVASYLGGDIVCGVVASGFDASDGASVFIDVGTNGEIGLYSNGKIYFCSAAAGPAFEGANIVCGSAGVEGAVSSVKLDGGELKIETIGGGKPKGICGSGIIDAIAAMLDAGVIDEAGSFDDGYQGDLVGEENGRDAFMIADGVFITEDDVRQVQLAKAAICAGILTLLHEAKTDVSDVKSVVLAGGFGSHIDVSSARKIGLLPRGITENVIFAGNTAGMGAVALLVGKEARKRASAVASESEYVELSASGFFMEAYIEEMGF